MLNQPLGMCFISFSSMTIEYHWYREHLKRAMNLGFFFCLTVSIDKLNNVRSLNIRKVQ
jgi:hypothetical protein